MWRNLLLFALSTAVACGSTEQPFSLGGGGKADEHGLSGGVVYKQREALYPGKTLSNQALTHTASQAIARVDETLANNLTTGFTTHAATTDVAIHPVWVPKAMPDGIELAIEASGAEVFIVQVCAGVSRWPKYLNHTALDPDCYIQDLSSHRLTGVVVIPKSLVPGASTQYELTSSLYRDVDVTQANTTMPATLTFEPWSMEKVTEKVLENQDPRIVHPIYVARMKETIEAAKAWISNNTSTMTTAPVAAQMLFASNRRSSWFYRGDPAPRKQAERQSGWLPSQTFLPRIDGGGTEGFRFDLSAGSYQLEFNVEGNLTCTTCIYQVQLDVTAPVASN